MDAGARNGHLLRAICRYLFLEALDETMMVDSASRNPALFGEHRLAAEFEPRDVVEFECQFLQCAVERSFFNVVLLLIA